MTIQRIALVTRLLGILAFGWAAPARPDLLEPAGMSELGARSSAVDSAARVAVLRAGVVAGPVDPDLYVVGPGDIFQLVLSGRVSRDEMLVVGPDGRLIVPGYGALKLQGLTLNQARLEVQRALGGEFRGVKLDLHLVRVRTMRVYVVGNVRNPGAYELPATSRVSDALSLASLAGDASHRNVRVLRSDGRNLVADLDLFDRVGRNDLNPYLQEGDVVQVPAAVRFVEIRGAVPRPGRIELGPADSLSTAIDLAGGALPSARPDRALLVRWTEPTRPDTIWFSLDDLGSGVQNPPMQDGDHVYLFFTARYHELEQVMILGEIQKPGSYPLVAGQTRLSDLVGAAGGFLPTADLRAVRIYRARSPGLEDDAEFERLSRLPRSEMTNSEYEVFRTKLVARREDFRVDWTKLAERPERDVLLLDRDVVRVDRLIASVRVEGEVVRPGIISFEQERGAEDYVRLAGGYSKRADGGKVRVTRAVTGQTLYARDVPVIAPGDLIWVPELPDKTVWQWMAMLIAIGAQMATIYIAVKP